jgi:metal-responsive CopG/Arc/MetJ family transcriptional regulator
MSSKLDHPLTIKLTDEMARQVEAFARTEGMESASEFVRHLITSEVDRRKRQYLALHEVFGNEVQSGNVNEVCRGVPRSVFHG